MFDIFTALERGACLVTASRRLARTLQHEYDVWRRQRGDTVWPSPDILPLSAWLHRVHEASFDTRLLLSAHAEQLVWEDTIHHSGNAHALMQIPATARMAASAWQLAREYRLTIPAEIPLSDEVRAWSDWRRRFEAWCEARGMLPAAALADDIIQRLATGHCPVPGEFWYCGFDELTPQQRDLFDAIAAAGSKVREFVWRRAQDFPALRLEVADRRGEIQAAADWCKAVLEARPDGRIGVIVPDLESCRAEVEQIFADTFLPHAVLPGSQVAAAPWNISLGFRLAERPLVFDALQLLALAVQRQLPLETASRLMRSPYLGGAHSELAVRALMDLTLRRSREPSVSLNWLIRKAQNCPQLLAGLEALQAGVDAVRGKLLPSAWAGHFSAWLALAGWPGEVVFNSDAWQTVVAANELFDAFAALDSVLGTLSMADALSRLGDLARQTLFQPESTPDIPIQIMGVLEAAGMQFDVLWVMGLHDEVWPQAARPNPFLPQELQRTLGLPQSSPEKELAFATLITQRLAQSAPQVVFSHPKRDADRDLTPSPLIAAFQLAPPEKLSLHHDLSLCERVMLTRQLETLQDDQAPPLPAGTLVSGGAGLFKHQAACPFRAFVRYRLHASEMAAATDGLDASDRGSLMHAALEGVWKHLKHHEALASASSETLDAVIRMAVADAVARIRRDRPLTLKDRLAALEEARLTGMVREWLKLEGQRQPFRVEAHEEDREVELGGLRVKTRIDRIDRVDGGPVVIDYKTGATDVRGWFGERPDEPQLPLYAVTADPPVAGIAFAGVRLKEMAFSGLGRVEGIAPQVEALGDSAYAETFSDWSALTDHWRQVLENLAHEFRQGEAAVLPKEGSKTCRYCEYKALCRIHEIEAAQGGSMDASDE